MVVKVNGVLAELLIMETNCAQKQLTRRTYGVLEKQFRRYYKTAVKSKGLTGVALLQNLEIRFDNVLYRMGFAASRAQARQLIAHRHFMVNGRITDVPSMQIKVGDKIEIREGSKKKLFFKELVDIAEERNAAEWLERDVKSLSGSMKRLPERSEIDANINEQLVVEYYSR